MDDNNTRTSTDQNQDESAKMTMAWSSLINAISHDLRTPVCTLGLIGSALADRFSILFEGYLLAVEHNLVEPKIPARHLRILQESTLPGTTQTADDMSKFLNVLYDLKQKVLSNSPDIQLLSIFNCVDEVIKKYAFAHKKERALLQVNITHDFKFTCAPVFMTHLLSNLLDNALYHIDQTGDGQINIWTAEEEYHHVLHFQDTAGTMSEDVLPRVFSRFFSKRNGNLVPGLGFCRLALLARGGDVVCLAVQNQYTDFAIKFAKEA
jgi:signal transduction histidine kinase